MYPCSNIATHQTSEHMHALQTWAPNDAAPWAGEALDRRAWRVLTGSRAVDHPSRERTANRRDDIACRECNTAQDRADRVPADE